ALVCTKQPEFSNMYRLINMLLKERQEHPLKTRFVIPAKAGIQRRPVLRMDSGSRSLRGLGRNDGLCYVACFRGAPLDVLEERGG
ncbi:MAG: hypothetical protein ACREXY_17675, partial [Gammaproteobacteria bacterium]